MGSLFRRFTAATVVAALLGIVTSTSALALATTFTEPIIIDLTGETLQGCTEPVVLTGSIHDVLHITERADGSHTFVVSSNPGGMYATGLTTGNVYRATGATHQTIVGGAPDETMLPEWGVVTYIDRTRLVGTGGAMTLDVWLTFHFTKLDHENVVHFERAKVTCS